jgi:hypothetical protein
MDLSTEPRLPGCPSDLELEEFLLGLGERENRAVHVTGCSHCRARVDWMQATEKFFFDNIHARARQALSTAARGGRWHWVWAPAGSLAMLAIALVWFRAPHSPDVRTKGGAPILTVYGAENGAALERLSDGSRVHPGEALRFRVSSGVDRVLLFTVDQTGTVSPLFSSQLGARVPQDGVLPDGAILDDQGGPERVFAVFPSAGQSLDWQEIAEAVHSSVPPGHPEALRTLARLPLNAPQSTVLLEKAP